MPRLLIACVVSGLLLCLPVAADAATLLVEAESFAELGGWVVDQQSMDVIGSPYLLAHGLGEPVADATTSIMVPEAGSYRVLVRTKNWVARWQAPGAPGKFQVLVNGQALPETLGTQGIDWSWHLAGQMSLPAGKATLALHDLTGFAGRCDAIVLSSDPQFSPPESVKELAVLRAKLLAIPEEPGDGGQYDLVVVGGGVAGCCSAVSAARLGLTVALVQDRPVLGGNSSSEVRVWIQGKIQQQPFPVIGEIVAEMLTKPKICPAPAPEYGDDLKMHVVRGQERLTLRLGEHVNRVECEDARIKAVVATNILTGRRTRYVGRWFVDATGDATVGFLAGADYDLQPEGHLGSSNMWYLEDSGKPASFPRCPWAIDLSDKPFPEKLEQLGHWFWESGFDRDTIGDAEGIRDHNFRAMYGAWDCLKNIKKLYPNHTLAWAAYISGKRESRRLLGDMVLTKEDVLDDRKFSDGCVASTWSIDLHYPEKRYEASSADGPFIAKAEFTRFKTPYLVPYRCLYSRNVPNLFMAGRCISVTHEALGTVRVMGTGGLMGECVGRAASLCKQYECNPREVYDQYLEGFLDLLHKPTKERTTIPPEFAKELGQNAARQATIATSGDRDAQQSPPSLLTDGIADTADNNQRWLSKAEVPNWVEFTWPEPRTIAAARIVSGYRSGSVKEPLQDFVLQYHDGQEWRDIPGTRTRGNDAVDWQCRFEPVRARRLRLLVEKAPKDISRIWEIELYEPKK